jgi:hypothetical protein
MGKRGRYGYGSSVSAAVELSTYDGLAPARMSEEAST